MKEEYKVIYDRYFLFKDGTILDKKSARFVKIHRNKYGYSQVNLNINGKFKTCALHRVIAEAYLPNPSKKRTVNHIDGVKSNNEVSNLEWNTHGENMRHAFKNNIRNSDHSKKRVLDVLTGEVFNSVIEVAEKHGISKYSLYKSLCGSRKNNKRFIYE